MKASRGHTATPILGTQLDVVCSIGSARKSSMFVHSVEVPVDDTNTMVFTPSVEDYGDRNHGAIGDKDLVVSRGAFLSTLFTNHHFFNVEVVKILVRVLL